MKQSILMPIEDGHFRWCPERHKSPPECAHDDHGCDRCKAWVYIGAIILSTLVAYLEFWGSGTTASLSLGSDAWHMAFDAFGYCIGFVGTVSVIWLHFSEKRTGKIEKYLEVLMALFLIATATFIFYEVGGRMWHGNVPNIVESRLLLAIAALGLAVNLVFLAFFQALKMGHAHGDDAHAHMHEDKILSANFWHTLGDAASSAMVVGNGIVYQLSRDPSSWFFLEFPVSLFIAGLLAWQGWKILFPKKG